MNTSSPSPNICIVYDRVNTPHGGAEYVLTLLHKLYPNAPLYTSVYDAENAEWARDFEVRTTFLQHIPGITSHHQWLAPLMPLAFESLDLSEFDMVLSVTSTDAKSVITTPEQLHICYCLTPTRYLHSHRDTYAATKSLFSLPVIGSWTHHLLDYLTWWDITAAQRPDHLIPISETVSQRIRDYYGRTPTEVIYPPVRSIAVSETLPSSLSSALPNHELPIEYLLCVGRHVSYKRYDLAIRAAAKNSIPLILVGNGVESAKLKALAHKLQADVTFLQQLDSQSVNHLLQQASGLLMPGIEDFGLVGLEALGAGTPVITNAKSGVAECIQHQIHGLHLQSESVQALSTAIKELLQTDWNSSLLSNHMTKYDDTVFKETFENKIATVWKQFRTKGVPCHTSNTHSQSS